MPIFDTESIVLKSYSLAEADRIVVFYTRDHGVVRGVAKGAKRLKSRFGSTLEPFSVVNLEYFAKEDRELVSINRADLVDSAFAVASEPAHLHTFAYLADLLIGFAPPNDPNETLYRMVKACRSVPLDHDADHLALRMYFELWLLRLGGFLPSWRECFRCRRPISELEAVDLDGEFHLLCGNCGRGRGIQKISPVHRGLFAAIQAQSPGEFVAYARLKREAAQELAALLQRVVAGALGHDRPIERARSSSL